jgi:hypothetical protein
MTIQKMKTNQNNSMPRTKMEEKLKVDIEVMRWRGRERNLQVKGKRPHHEMTTVSHLIENHI